MSRSGIAFKCIECHIVNVFAIHNQDGHKCGVCGGHLIPIGKAIVNQTTEVTVTNKTVEITGIEDLRKAIDKMNRVVSKAISLAYAPKVLITYPRSNKNAF